MKVNFYSKSILSLLDLTTIGGSDKLGDDSKIGQFCSGLKYALALFLRNGVKFTAKTSQVVYGLGGFDRTVETNYFIDKYIKEDEFAGHSKELIQIRACYEYESFHSYNTIDEFCEDVPLDEVYETGISTNLGFDWKLEYALREIWSNMIDEEGWYLENSEEGNFKHGTIITLEFPDDSQFADIWNRRNEFFITDEALISFENSSGKKVELRNSDKFRIYKQGILVYEAEEESKSFSYNINFGDLDERRILLNPYNVKYNITTIISNSLDVESIDFLLKLERGFTDFKGITDISVYDISTKIKEKVSELEGDIKTFEFLEKALKKLPDTPLAGRSIRTLENSVWEMSKEVVIEQTASEVSLAEEAFDTVSKLKSKYKLPFDMPIKEAVLKGSLVVADKYNKVILISEEFDVENEDHVILLLIQMFDLSEEGTGNILKKLTKYILKSL